ncbi:hypothetical protein MA16_Dca022267 [Dendrobium catenatum]|uniref:Uncharacterized protein n=1 Tax=Dendrobium catenatum TaxID=906689 RepID=A0A2I0XB96_9ASPA|nr:hypothetical protein MA16_Dca022267 [Dendrobium catenatum]
MGCLRPRKSFVPPSAPAKFYRDLSNPSDLSPTKPLAAAGPVALPHCCAANSYGMPTTEKVFRTTFSAGEVLPGSF